MALPASGHVRRMTISIAKTIAMSARSASHTKAAPS